MRSGVLPSFWNRLLERNSPTPSEGNSQNPPAIAVPVSEFEKSVLSDVETLLNERRPKQDEIPQTARPTILGYGLPELTSFDLSSSTGADRLALAIQETIRSFEPRLYDVVVSADHAGSRTVFRIRANIRLQPASERVRFEAVINPGNSRVELIY
jgi:type VI secretion system protein ImpF